MKFLFEPLINSIMLCPVSESEIAILLNNFSIKKGVGSDGLPAKIWKDNLNVLTPVLTCLIN